MAVIYSKQGMHPEAAHNYKKAILKCQETPELRESQTYKKAATNYSIILERLGQRDQAIALLTELQATFNSEVRVANNIGILRKRQGDVDAAVTAYQSALHQQPDAFYPNYNLGVLLASESKYHEAVGYLEHALAICESQQLKHADLVRQHLQVCSD